jgi:glycosyltransferase involved in cell wall biosynthesis
MRFHLIGDPRIPVHPDYIHDSYNTKIFRFIKLFQDTHKILVYGPDTHQKYFTHPNISYYAIIDIEAYKDIDVFHPSVMLAGSTVYKDLCDQFTNKAKKAIQHNYRKGDLVLATTLVRGLDPNILYMNYSVGCFDLHSKYATCESEFIKDVLCDKFNPEILTVIPPYFDINDFPVIDIEREPHTYLFLGRCSSLKGLCKFMLVAEYYRKNGIPGNFIVAGPCEKSEPHILRMSWDNGTYYDYDLNSYSNVQYIGIADGPTRNHLYRQATCLIQLSEYDEPCGYNVIEAQYCGCPVIASNRGGLRENIIQGKTGFLSNDTLFKSVPNSWYNITETLNYLKQIPTIKSLDCHQSVLSFFDKTSIYKQTLEVFNQIVDHQTRPSLTVVIPDQMKTIHTNLTLSIGGHQILKQLYRDVLATDNKFHYFWEPYLILRVSNNRVKAVTKWWDTHYPAAKYHVYDYPIAKRTGLPKNEIIHVEQEFVLKNFDLFVKLFHIQSITGITMPSKDQSVLRERMIHTMYNEHGIMGENEVNEIRALSESRQTYNKSLK